MSCTVRARPRFESFRSSFRSGCCAALLLAVACSRRGQERPEHQPALVLAANVAAAPSSAELEPYPRARWRLLTFAELELSTLWVSHIAIRHRESNSDWFRRIGWAPDPPNPDRSPDEAFEIASRLAELVGRNPGEFASVARQHSEDVVTRERGGSLGGVRATQLHPDFLDVLATLQRGHVSRVFRTPYAYHVLMRGRTPPERAVSGRRIVIAYRGTVGGVNADGVQRTREEARALAQSISARARAGQETFESLVAQYSDTADRERSGDLGVWSLRDPGYFPAEIELLDELEINAVSEPLDSRFGFEILQRTPVTERARYAMEVLQLKFDRTVTEPPYSRAAIEALAHRLGAELKQDPSRFDALRREHCCMEIRRWTSGRGPAEVEAQLQGLAFGQIASNPVLSDSFYLIPRRLDPATLEPEPLRKDGLPSPEYPNFDAFIDFNDGRMIASMARALNDDVSAEPAFEGPPARSIGETLTELAAMLETDPTDHERIRHDIHAAVQELEQQLGPERFARFRDYARSWVVERVLR